jgi:hypothetical protein
MPTSSGMWTTYSSETSASYTPRRQVLDLRSGQAGVLMAILPLGRVFSQYFSFPCPILIPPIVPYSLTILSQMPYHFAADDSTLHSRFCNSPTFRRNILFYIMIEGLSKRLLLLFLAGYFLDLYFDSEASDSMFLRNVGELYRITRRQVLEDGRRRGNVSSNIEICVMNVDWINSR